MHVKTSFVLLVITLIALSSGTARFVPPTSSRLHSSDPLLILDQANRLSWLDNWTDAAPLYSQAEVLFRVNGDKRNEIYARIGRISSERMSRSFAATSRLLERELRKPTVKRDPRLHLWCLASKGYVDIDIDTESAKQSWSEAFGIATALGENQWASRAKGELGVVAFLQGNFALAVKLVGESLLSLIGSGDTAGAANLLTMLGDGYDTVHRFREAHWFLTHAITLLKANPNAGFPFNAEVGDAEALNGQGKRNEAIEVLQTVLSRARTDKQYGHEANALLTLGEIELQAHELDSAKEDLMKAAEVSGHLHLYRILAESLTSLAKTYLLEGNSEAAEVAIHRAFAARSHLRDVYLAPVAFKVAAELKISENRLSAAASLFDKAETIIDKMALNDDTDLGRAALAGSMSDIYLEHFQLLQRQGNVARALQILERVRGRSWATRVHSTKDVPDNAKERADLEANIASLQMQLLGTDDQNIREELKEKLLQNERILALENNEVKRLRDRFVPVSLTAIQARLRSDELLLEYVLGEPHVFCIAVTSNEARLLELPAGSGQVEALSTSYLRDLRARRLNPPLAQRMYNILLQQAEGFHKARWIIAPDGGLNFLPFEALVGHDGDFIVNSQIVSYTPSATSLEISRASRNLPGRRRLLALGDVDYAARQLPERTSRVANKIPAGILRDVTSLGARLQNLPETREEVLSIAQAVGQASKVLLGEQATESAFKAEPVSDYRIIHLAVHAISDSDFPDRSALVLAADQPPEDGFLQVREVTRLHIHADLVTLSACQTGIGPTEGEAGVISLQHAFLMSGAKAVVASLWNVEDRSTTELMEAFYRHLTNHEDKASALTRAKREFVQQHVPPYFWAGFVITGEVSSGVY